MPNRIATRALVLLLVPGIGYAQSTGISQVWRNYDFVPGTTVWKATDFRSEQVGRFPASQLEFLSGNMQIVERDGVKVLEATAPSVFRISLPRNLPESFTIEFDLKNPTPNIGVSLQIGTPVNQPAGRDSHDYMNLTGQPGIYRRGVAISAMRYPLNRKLTPIRLQVDGTYAILYADSTRVAQVPTANFARGRSLEFRLDANARFSIYITNVVVAVGLSKLYESLTTIGEFTTRGILFDTSSDRLRPESTPVLEQLYAALRDHTELKVSVEGHTDDDGDASTNLTLSARRAASVVQAMVDRGIAANRLTATGKGELVPTGDNATSEGRQQNRRVVIRKP